MISAGYALDLTGALSGSATALVGNGAAAGVSSSPGAVPDGAGVDASAGTGDAGSVDTFELVDEGAADRLYLTDHPEQLRATIEGRAGLYTPGLRSSWADQPAQFRTVGGEEILVISGLEVMRGFEKPYMISIADTVTQGGGLVLNVGYGLGIIDDHIERLGRPRGMTKHHIVELNRQVLERGEAWKSSQANADQIRFRQGDWKDALHQFHDEGLVFDGVAYDAFPLEEQDLHRDFIPFLELLMRLRLVKEETGIITFYLDSSDGFGQRFVQYARALGVGAMSATKVQVELPPNQYWRAPFFLTPKLTNIHYPERAP